jgi:hypothetical protein
MSGLLTNSLELSMSDKTEKPKKGDIIEDADGTKWHVQGVVMHNGKPVPQKIRVGSLAAKLLGYEDPDPK